MPLQNRVDPWGALNIDPSRGQYMGNRGILHKDKKIVKNWAHKAWIFCALEFKDMKRGTLFQDNKYSELFFLDAATALAAGHRPCALYQREEHNKFKSMWSKTFPGDAPALVGKIDNELHSQRAIRGGAKVTYDAQLKDLPTGAMFELNDRAYLVSPTGPRTWSFNGYGAIDKSIDKHHTVKVLTPRAIVDIMAAGYQAEMHPSALA